MPWFINKDPICTDKVLSIQLRCISEHDILILKNKCTRSDDWIIHLCNFIMFPLSHEGKFPIFLICQEVNLKSHLNSSLTVPSIFLPEYLRNVVLTLSYLIRVPQEAFWQCNKKSLACFHLSVFQPTLAH